MAPTLHQPEEMDELSTNESISVSTGGSSSPAGQEVTSPAGQAEASLYTSVDDVVGEDTSPVFEFDPGPTEELRRSHADLSRALVSVAEKVEAFSRSATPSTECGGATTPAAASSPSWGEDWGGRSHQSSLGDVASGTQTPMSSEDGFVSALPGAPEERGFFPQESRSDNMFSLVCCGSPVCFMTLPCENAPGPRGDYESVPTSSDEDVEVGASVPRRVVQHASTAQQDRHPCRAEAWAPPKPQCMESAGISLGVVPPPLLPPLQQMIPCLCSPLSQLHTPVCYFSSEEQACHVCEWQPLCESCLLRAVQELQLLSVSARGFLARRRSTTTNDEEDGIGTSTGEPPFLLGTPLQETWDRVKPHCDRCTKLPFSQVQIQDCVHCCRTLLVDSGAVSTLGHCCTAFLRLGTNLVPKDVLEEAPRWAASMARGLDGEEETVDLEGDGGWGRVYGAGGPRGYNGGNVGAAGMGGSRAAPICEKRSASSVPRSSMKLNAKTD